jgi:hypothetical protein
MDMQLPPIGSQHEPSQHGRGMHGSYDSGSAAAAAAAAQHHRASVGSGNVHSPRIVTGQSPQQGHPAMFSQGNNMQGYNASPQQQPYGNPALTGGAPHHAYQQQQQQQSLYGTSFGQHPNQQVQQQQQQQGHHSASPHQHYSHISGSSVGLGGGQFGSPGGGPMMTGASNDYSLHGHPSYTHMHQQHPGAQQQPHQGQQQAQHQQPQQQHNAYGGHFAMPGMQQHLQQGGPGMMMPGHHLSAMGQNPMAMHGSGPAGMGGQSMTPMNRGPGQGQATKAKVPGQGPGSGRGRKSKKVLEAAAAAAAQAAVGMPGMMTMHHQPQLQQQQQPQQSLSQAMRPDPTPKIKAAGRHHPYEGETGPKKKTKKEEPPKPPVLKSHLKPPKQAPSAWQVYFTEELQKMKQEQPGERLNVAHVAKDAGQRYAALPAEERKVFQRKSLEAKAEWEREMEVWRQTLTPEDIKQENMFRTAQRKAGKSRKGNLKDPNAPKKPLSAYFLFLRAIRADPALTQSVFEGEQETTKQSVLAASKWRGLPEAEKQPYLEKAEADKSDYEKQRREYEATHAHERKAGLIGAAKQEDSDGDDDDEGEHADDDLHHTAADQFQVGVPYTDDHFIGAPLDDHFGTNPDGTTIKPEDLM